MKCGDQQRKVAQKLAASQMSTHPQPEQRELKNSEDWGERDSRRKDSDNEEEEGAGDNSGKRESNKAKSTESST